MMQGRSESSIDRIHPTALNLQAELKNVSSDIEKSDSIFSGEQGQTNLREAFDVFLADLEGVENDYIGQAEEVNTKLQDARAPLTKRGFLPPSRLMDLDRVIDKTADFISSYQVKLTNQYDYIIREMRSTVIVGLQRKSSSGRSSPTCKQKKQLGAMRQPYSSEKTHQQQEWVQQLQQQNLNTNKSGKIQTSRLDSNNTPLPMLPF